MRTKQWWESKAAALCAAHVRVYNALPATRNGMYLELAQCTHESSCGDWRGSCNWGACDLRSLTAAEAQALADGRLELGDWIHADGTWGKTKQANTVGFVWGDSDPNVGAFHVVFFAGPTDTDGAAYYLHYGIRGVIHVLDDPACSPDAFARALYVDDGYFGGFHPTPAEAKAGMPHPRPYGKRTGALNAAELANVSDYAHALAALQGEIAAALDDWSPVGLTYDAAQGEIVTDAPPPETAPTGGDANS